MKETVSIYKNLEDYADNRPTVMIQGVKACSESKVGGWLFITDKEEHVLPKDIIFTSVKEE